MVQSYEAVICGAGIAGVSAAYHLAVQHGWRDVLLVDERAPLSLTSDKSTECYRNWWPGPGNAMVALMNRSIDLLESLAVDSQNVFHLNRRGYLYLTGDEKTIPGMLEAAQEPPRLGAGALRVYRGRAGDPEYRPSEAEGYQEQLTGADLFLNSALIRRYFPYVSDQVVAALHVRRAGWFSAQQLGTYLLEQARTAGVRRIEARVSGVEIDSKGVQAVRLQDGRRLPTRRFVNAAGPFLKQVGSLLGIDLPVFNELHLKVSYRDPQGVVPREAPLLIWSDAQWLPWSAEERELLAEEQSTRWLLDEMPPGAHLRPEGGAASDIILLLWEYHSARVDPVWPPVLDEQYPEVALRGMAAMLPGMRQYFERAARPMLDGGYYTKTIENRPLICPTQVGGAYVIGALSGYGLMAACAAGELLAAHMTGGELPAYAGAFHLDRYQEPAYQHLLENWGASGQL